MNKKLESRIARLERMMNSKSIKNEATDPVATAVYATASKVNQLVNDLCKTIAYSNISNYGDVAHALQMCKDSFSKKDNVIFNSIFGCRKNGI